MFLLLSIITQGNNQ